MNKIVLILVFSSLLLFSDNKLNIGYYKNSFHGMSKEGVMIANNVYMNELVNDINHTSKSKIYDDINEVVNDINTNELDYIVTSGLDFVMYFDLNKLIDGFMQGYEDGSKEVFIIIVLENSTMKNVSDLYKKKISVQKNDLITKLYVENKILEKYKKLDVNFELYPTKQRALLKLFFGKVDAAIITNKSFELISELNPQIGKKVRVLEVTNIEAKNFGFFNKSLNEESRTLINKQVKSLHETTRGKQILNIFKTDSIVESKLVDLKIIDEIYKNNMRLKKGKDK
jgi:ABC-type phosphate/phosphonate transport system substrate-binding protein